MKHHAHPRYNCPGCGKRNDSATHVSGDEEENAPRPGDFCVCIGCGCLLTFEADGARRLTAEDEARASPETMAVLQRARQFIMDKNFIDSHVVGINGTAQDAVAFIEKTRARGDEVVLIGTRCADGPPGPKQIPARRDHCARCDAAIWTRRDAPAGPWLCSRCAAKFLRQQMSKQA